MTPGRTSSLAFTRASRSVMVSVSVSLSYSAFMRRVHIPELRCLVKRDYGHFRVGLLDYHAQQHLRLENFVQVTPHKNLAWRLAPHGGIRLHNGLFYVRFAYLTLVSFFFRECADQRIGFIRRLIFPKRPALVVPD